MKKIKIHDISHEGAGVGRDDDGQVVFIDGAIPDELVSYKVVNKRKRFSKAKLVDVIEASEDRVPAKCPVYEKCGGCVLQHMKPEAQRLYKQKQLFTNLSKLAKLDNYMKLDYISASDWAYRRRVRFSVDYNKKTDDIRLGFRSRASHDIQATSSCDLVVEEIQTCLPSLELALKQLSEKQKIQSVEICSADNVLALLFWLNESLGEYDKDILRQLAQEQGLSVWLRDYKNKEAIEERLDAQSATLQYNLAPGIKLEFLPSDFIQVNADINEHLVAKAISALDLNANDKVLDLFCGLGNFTLPLAKHAGHVVGVEGDSGLIERAKYNADLNELSNVDFFVADLFEEKLRDKWAKQKYDKIILDPPRAGAAELIKNIDRFKASRIVYVSCDPATLARDANILVNQHGYTLSEAGIADMFPHTAHVESIAVFNR